MKKIKSFPDFLNESIDQTNFEAEIKKWTDENEWGANSYSLADYLKEKYPDYTFDPSSKMYPTRFEDQMYSSQEIKCNGKTFISYTTDSDGCYIGDLEIYFDALD